MHHEAAARFLAQCDAGACGFTKRTLTQAVTGLPPLPAVGTGLGLWVSKQLIEKHHGLIQMRSSTEGSRKGSTFSVVPFRDK